MSGRAPVRRRLFLLLTLTAAVCFSALGIWQIERRAWKLDLIERVQSRIHAPAIPAPSPTSWSSINAADDAYRHISIEGRFLSGRDTLVKAVTEKGPGFWLLTPLRTKDGAIVLINRGFVPSDWRDDASHGNVDSQKNVRVTGLLRITEPRGGFLRSNDPGSDRWYSRDVDAIAAARKLDNTAPFFVDADRVPGPEVWPLGGLTVVTFSNNHFIYVLTWFVLAIMAGGAAWLILRDDWRTRSKSVGSGAPTHP